MISFLTALYLLIGILIEIRVMYLAKQVPPPDGYVWRPWWQLVLGIMFLACIWPITQFILIPLGKKII